MPSVNSQSPFKHVPEGYSSVTPWIASRNTAQLIEYLSQAFGAKEVARVTSPDGTIGHAEVRIGDAAVLMFDAHPEWPDTPALLRLYVPDADVAFDRAVAAGGKPVTDVTTLAFGDRVGRVADPLGNVWWIQAHVEDVPPEEMEKRMQQSPYMEGMQYVQQSLVEELKPHVSRR
jgi:PhnB protein